MKTSYPLFVGNVQHAGSFDFPVLYEPVEVDRLADLFDGADYLEERLCEGARRLEDMGVKAIVGACASFGYFQRAVAGSVSIPVALSVLTQVPFLARMMGNGRLGVICANAASMNDRIYAQCGVEDPNRLVIAQMAGRAEFDRMLSNQQRLDFSLMADEVYCAASEILESASDVRAILLQCSDLPPFAAHVQARLGLPVFDMTRLIHWLQSCANYRSYH